MSSSHPRRLLWQRAASSAFHSNHVTAKMSSIFHSNIALGTLQEDTAVISSPAHHSPASIKHTRRCVSSQPFYGAPSPLSSRYDSCEHSDGTSDDSRRKDKKQYHHHLPPLTPLQRLATLVHSSFTALNDPTRADAVAAVGEVTGSYALSNIMSDMERDKIGRRILNDRPIVDETVSNRAVELLQQHNKKTNTTNIQFHNPTHGERGEKISFGAAYARFLQTHDFDPNERDAVRFISDPNLSYVMTRYRQNHDYWHVLTGLPPTVLGELALKWLELMQTGLPLAALSAIGGSLGAASGLSAKEREILIDIYIPWAIRVGGNMQKNALMCVYYEEELETDVDDLRKRVGIELAPTLKCASSGT